MALLDTSTAIMPSRHQIIADAVNEIVQEQPGIQNDPVGFATAANNRVIFKMIDYFPLMCEDARKVNQAKYEFYKEHGNKGRFTDTYGWSNDRTMLFDYDIPPDLYHFMQSIVYKDFWSEDNERVWRGFMKKICRSNCPLTALEAHELLIKTKQLYGPNQDQGLTN